MISRRLCICVTAVLALGFAENALAQRSAFDVAGGYQFTGMADQTLPVGWSAGISTPIGGAWGLAAEVSGAYRTERDQDLGVDVRLSVHTLGIGVRWSSRGPAGVVPFLQVLGGASRATAHARPFDTDVGETSTSFMLQPGAGVDVGLSDSVGLVGQADYRRVFIDEDRGESAAHQFRLFVGVRVGL
jgi:hypothetical protein